jgi:methionyl-tRNA formyltransferase
MALAFERAKRENPTERDEIVDRILKDCQEKDHRIKYNADEQRDADNDTIVKADSPVIYTRILRTILRRNSARKPYPWVVWTVASKALKVWPYRVLHSWSRSLQGSLGTGTLGRPQTGRCCGGCGVLLNY